MTKKKTKKSAIREVKPSAYVDLASLPENKRLDVIAAYVIAGKKIAVVVDDDPGKLERYMNKLANRVKRSFIYEYAGAGPVPQTAMFTVRLENN